MKKLSRSEMKKVMGGDVREPGCYVYCGMCQEGNGGPGCQFGGWIPVETCEGAGNATCAGMFFHRCTCGGGGVG